MPWNSGVSFWEPGWCPPCTSKVKGVAMASRKLFISLLALTLIACARNEDGAPAAPATVRTMELAQPGISIARDAYVLARGGPMTEIAPLNTGGRIKDCRVSPALPAGLVLDTKYCVISGTPTVFQDEITYTVVAENQYGTSAIDIKLKVSQGLLEGLLETAFNSVGYKSSETVGATPILLAMIPQAEGKVLLGYSIATGHKWLRYNADGTKDATSLNVLGSSCYVILNPVGGEACELGAAMGLANGRLLVSYVGLTNNEVRVARYLSDGNRDNSFGTSGVAKVAGVTATAVPVRVRELTNGKTLLLVQLTSASAPSGSAPAVIRLNVNGSLDTGFGTGGIAFVAGLHHANSLDADSATGRVYVGGAVATLPADEALVVLKTDGTAETGAIPLAANSAEAHDLLFDSSARKVLVLTNTSGLETKLTRHNADGSVDTAFGAGGSVTRALGSDNVARRLRVDRWGNIFVIGNEGFGGNSYFTVTAFTAAGAELTGFGTAGVLNGVDPAAQEMTAAEFNAEGNLILAGLAAANAAVAVLK